MSIKKKNNRKKKIGIILMTYGSPKTLNDIPEYLKRIYTGKQPSSELIKEFRRRYKLIEGSPLIKITNQQAAALQKELNNQYSDRAIFQVMAGMRFSQPFISEVIPKIANQAEQIIGIIMSPQYSPIIMKGYINTLENSVNTLNRKGLKLNIVKNWHLQPYFIQALTQRVNEALENLPSDVSNSTLVLFSAHSMPKRVIDKDPDYIKSLKQTAAEIAKQAGLPLNRWMFCYQSAGHSPEEWLKPDFADIMPELKKAGHTHIIIAPIQFLADHLEILYDIDIAAREQAENHGIKFTRTKSLNTSPLFIKALATVVKEFVQN